jgi:hypothetical protein
MHATCLTHLIIHAFIAMIIDEVTILKLQDILQLFFTLCFNLLSCKIRGFYSGASENESLVGCETVFLGK